ncbi:MAG: trimethylamine methyltransferase family protein [Anaerolineales bacterium]|nr:trimethylamine methyltransferase family protein [Anaerolineales bacterium]
MIKPVQWTTRLELIPDRAIRDIHQASLQILERTGLNMVLSPGRKEQAGDLGLQVERDTHRIRFPPEIVESALAQAPPTYTLCARNPENDLVLDGNHGYLSLDGSGTQIIDLETGELRESTKADLDSIARAADALPQISFLWPSNSAQDCPARVQPLYELEALVVNSSKHVQAMTAVDALNAQGTIEIASEIAGGREALRERPLISNFQCSQSPLSYGAHALEAAWIFGEAGIPTGFLAMPIGFATAPATVAGIAALTNAEVLAGIALFELLFPGAPTFYGACGTMMDLRTGGITSGGPHDFLLQAAACQLARFYDLPASVGTFSTGAKASDWQAGAENGVSGAISMLAGADMMSGAGLMHGARIFSYEQLLMDCELYDMLQPVVQGFQVNEETLALDTIHETGPQNNFLMSGHTLAHMRDGWQPSLIEHLSWEDWMDKGQPTPNSRAREKAKQLLATHEPEPLPCAERIREIITDFENK